MVPKISGFSFNTIIKYILINNLGTNVVIKFINATKLHYVCVVGLKRKTKSVETILKELNGSTEAISVKKICKILNLG
ncbi:hypothetical protein [Algibacter pectinivorans]|uniref:Uncharacterized protein n=1 Tax=Algibacter pectinivorans TaxID=870482 RepID=A0A1I1RZ02_9FLAO|nr:hypothetical protein [Algibacter pectinivorans]SFD39515.1 hypothetical protein SAMN04487987_11226 [Algibacter pectinivorans]